MSALTSGESQFRKSPVIVCTQSHGDEATLTAPSKRNLTELPVDADGTGWSKMHLGQSAARADEVAARLNARARVVVVS
jgi:hypothetical protein